MSIVLEECQSGDTLRSFPYRYNSRYHRFIFPKSSESYFLLLQPSTLSFNSFPTLKNGSIFGLILTRSPVFGLRPVYDPYSLTKNEQNPRISTRPPLASSPAIPLKKMSTIAAASGLDMSVVFQCLYHLELVHAFGAPDNVNAREMVNEDCE